MLFGLTASSLWLFAAAVLLLVLTPGPVWIYLLSRTLAQGRRAGYFSLFGVASGVVMHVLLAAAGLSAVVLAIPGAFQAVKLAGAAYLIYLAFSTLRGGGFTFSPQPLPAVPDRVLFRQALAASVLNPKVAVFYLSLFPQFINPVAGSVFGQSVVLGIVHVLVSLVFDSVLVTIAALLSGWFIRRPAWLRAQRWFLGSAFGALAIWLALSPVRAR
ncbi:MAG TPA: LysE family translocator [Burkholderiaceae bacterium]|nr:LysE family translocator [Burkholderiaceae bacterium]